MALSRKDVSVVSGKPLMMTRKGDELRKTIWFN